MAAPPSDSEVRIQKVDKLDLVFSILTKPTVFYGGAGGRNGGSNAAMAPGGGRRPGAAGGAGAGRKLAGAGVAGSGNTHATTSSRGIVSIEDINKRSENYIRDRKRMFFGQN
uniref:Uncharacterized protein n=1 Tax=Leersia perrieri TaxID=77586 RepID=A0A0D9WCL9_9ORYZ